MNDHNRPLNDIGFKDASMMGKRLYDRGVSFDQMLSSTAIRALTTCQLIAAEINYSLESIKTNKEIYGADITTIKEIIAKTESNKVESLAVYGHNPTLYFLVEEILGEHIEKFSTCSMLYVKFDTDKWTNCFNSKKEIIFFEFPENIG